LEGVIVFMYGDYPQDTKYPQQDISLLRPYISQSLALTTNGHLGVKTFSE